MTCEEVKLLISARMDGEINAVQCVAIDSHLEAEACGSCNEEMEAQETLRVAIRDQMPYYRAPAQLRERLTSALRAAQLAMWHDKQWRSPYYWGAFTLQGEWR